MRISEQEKERVLGALIVRQITERKRESYVIMISEEKETVD